MTNRAQSQAATTAACGCDAAPRDSGGENGHDRRVVAAPAKWSPA